MNSKYKPKGLNQSFKSINLDIVFFHLREITQSKQKQFFEWNYIFIYVGGFLFGKEGGISHFKKLSPKISVLTKKSSPPSPRADILIF